VTAVVSPGDIAYTMLGFLYLTFPVFCLAYFATRRDFFNFNFNLRCLNLENHRRGSLCYSRGGDMNTNNMQSVND
jgi:hypothetical protein